MTEGMPEVRYVGIPDGPQHFVPEFGLEVGTFTQEPGGKHPSLRWHVPLNMRGVFRPEQLANYESEREYKVDAHGYVLCHGVTLADVPCGKRAVNRYPRCVVHGGRLHPLDRLMTETGEPETEENLSRYQMFLAKQITAADLDDDELLSFGFRKADGKLFKPKNVPREMVTAFTQAIFERSLDKLRSSALEAANTLVSIMTDPSVDASVRRLAAESVLDRTVGKAALNINVTASAPWEQVFEAISVKPSNIVDAEVVPEEELKRPALPPDVKIRDTE